MVMHWELCQKLKFDHSTKWYILKSVQDNETHTILWNFAMQMDHLILFTNPSAQAGYDTRSIFKRSLTGLNSEFSFSYTSCLTNADEHSLSHYLPIDGGRIIGFIPFPRVLVLCEMQLVSSRIWTCVAVSISNDDNHYTTGTSERIILC